MPKYTQELLEWAVTRLEEQGGHRRGVVDPETIRIVVRPLDFGCDCYDECCCYECTCGGEHEEDELYICITGQEPMHHYLMRKDSPRVSRYTAKAYIRRQEEPDFDRLGDEIFRANKAAPFF